MQIAGATKSQTKRTTPPSVAAYEGMAGAKRAWAASSCCMRFRPGSSASPSGGGSQGSVSARASSDLTLCDGANAQGGVQVWKLHWCRCPQQALKDAPVLAGPRIVTRWLLSPPAGWTASRGRQAWQIETSTFLQETIVAGLNVSTQSFSSVQMHIELADPRRRTASAIVRLHCQAVQRAWQGFQRAYAMSHAQAQDPTEPSAPDASEPLVRLGVEQRGRLGATANS